MEIAFETKELRELCENDDVAKRVLGEDVAGALKRRLADLRAATTIDDVVASPAEQIDDSPYLRIIIGYDRYIRFVANHVKNPTSEAGEIDWSRVNRIKISEIS